MEDCPKKKDESGLPDCVVAAEDGEEVLKGR